MIAHINFPVVDYNLIFIKLANQQRYSEIDETSEG